MHAAVGERIEILRDRAGVPHIYAGTTADAYFGLGYAMGQDRLWQMDRLRRRALGRQAEILGPAYVESDLQHLAVGIPAIAEREVSLTDDRTAALLEAFVAGINRWIESRERELPLEFRFLGYEPEPFSVRDTVATMRGIWWSLNGRLQQLTIAEAASYLPEHLRAAYLEPEASESRILPADSPYPAAARSENGAQGMGDGTGSNNWAVAGSRTRAGRALLSSDPHQPFWVPSSWYEYAIHGPEDHAAGAGHPGVPGLWFGSNGTVAWGITNNAASTRDLYREQVHPTDPSLYRDGDQWRPFQEQVLEVKVRGQASVRHTQRSTVRGPIVNHVVPALDADDPPLALRWVGQEHLDDIRAVVAIGRARDWESFRAALRDWAVAVFNFGYADASGRVGYQCAGRIPARGRVARGYRDPHDAADVWQGYVPFDMLPSAVDPERGYVASANQRVAPDDYPVALHGAFASGHRGERIQQVLESSAAFDRAATIALQNDVKSCRAERLCPPLLAHLASSDDSLVLTLHNALAAWDYRYTLDSIAPTLFDTFMEVWQARVAREHFPERLLPLVQAQSGPAARLIERADLAWFSASDLASELRAAAAESVRQVRARFGEDRNGWKWGTVHQAHWRHPLSASGLHGADIGPAPVDGGADTLRNTGAGQPAFAANGGAEYRLVVDFAEPTKLLAIQNIGNSGDPASPHYADQFTAWLAGEYHVVSLERQDVERDLESSLVLEPREVRA